MKLDGSDTSHARPVQLSFRCERHLIKELTQRHPVEVRVPL